jgi:TAP42-like family
VEYEGVLPLGVAFERALSLLGWDCASAAEPTGGPLRDAAAARAALAAAQRAVDALGLFSSNEDVEDLATPSMRYLLLPFLAAELENSRDTAREPAARMAQLRRAKEQYEAFLARAEQYSFAPQGALERGGRDGCSDHGLDIQRPLDPGAARAAKIARFKRSRELAGALAALRARRHTAISVRGGDDGGAGGSGGDDGPGWDEDDDRTLWGATLESCVLTTLDALPLLQQELALLEHAAANGGSCSGSGGDAVAQTDGRVQHRSGGAAAVRERDTAATAAIMSQLSDIAGQLRLGGRPTRDELRQQARPLLTALLSPHSNAAPPLALTAPLHWRSAAMVQPRVAASIQPGWQCLGQKGDAYARMHVQNHPHTAHTHTAHTPTHCTNHAAVRPCRRYSGPATSCQR